MAPSLVNHSLTFGCFKRDVRKNTVNFFLGIFFPMCKLKLDERHFIPSTFNWHTNRFFITLF